MPGPKGRTCGVSPCGAAAGRTGFDQTISEQLNASSRRSEGVPLISVSALVTLIQIKPPACDQLTSGSMTRDTFWVVLSYTWIAALIFGVVYILLA
jgi:hypothetical protein